MSRGFIAGMTDYSHQTIDDIISDLKLEVEFIQETLEIIQEKINNLSQKNYWQTVPYDFQSIVAYSLKFFDTSVKEILQINIELLIEVKEYHIRQLRKMAKVARDLNSSFGTTWHNDYGFKDYSNSDFRIVELIYAKGRDMVVNMLDISNMASRLEDYVGKQGIIPILIKRKIAFISASPEDHDRIRVDKEIARIEEQMEASRYRDNFDIIKREASKITSLTKIVLESQPEIIHFSGHGDSDGIIFENDDNTHVLIKTEALKIIFTTLAQKLEILIINACNSDILAESISKNNFYVVGMSDSIYDDDAINFSIGFYQAIGAGVNVHQAFQNALVIMLQNPNSMNLPNLWHNGIKI
jgi:hypothetical protein